MRAAADGRALSVALTKLCAVGLASRADPQLPKGRGMAMMSDWDYEMACARDGMTELKRHSAGLASRRAVGLIGDQDDAYADNDSSLDD